jgi:AraC-like DNA-binding protein
MKHNLARVRVSIVAFNLTRIERYDYSPGFSLGIAPHAHDEWQVCYSSDSVGHIRPGRVWVEAQAQRLYLIPPGVEHTCARDAQIERPSTYFVFYIPPSLVDWRGVQAIDQTSGGVNGCIESGSHDAVRLARSLIQGVDDGMTIGELEDGAARLLKAVVPGIREVSSDLPLARRVRDALLVDPIRCATLAELARVTGATPHRVRSAFKAAFGLPPARYHLMRRLSSARDLIRVGVAPGVVAARLGFVDQAHLTHRLRRYFGHRPGSIVRG